MGSVCISFIFYFIFGGRGVNFRSYADWLVRRQYVINVISRRTKCGLEKCALLAQLGAMDCLLELISPTNAYASCGRLKLNFIERLVLGHSLLFRPLAERHVYRFVCRTVELKDVLHSFSFYIICATNKASENLTFVLKQSLILSSVFVVIIICCLAAIKIKDCRTYYIIYISK